MPTPDRDELFHTRHQADHLANVLGLHLYAMRISAELSLRQLAERSGVRVDVLQRAEKGRWVLSRDQLTSVLDALDGQPS